MKKTNIIDQLKDGQTVAYYTIGVSMQPLLVERQTHVIIEPLKKAEAKDILLYVRSNGSVVLHRLIKQDENYYYMRGDNTLGLEPIMKNQAFGVVSKIYKNEKYIDVKNDFKYKLYVFFRLADYPVRFVFRHAYAYFRAFCSKALRLIKKIVK